MEHKGIPEQAFKFGVGFGQFSAMPSLENRAAVLNVLPARMKDRLPDTNELKETLWWDFDPGSVFPGEWTADTDRCYQTGLLGYYRFLLSLPDLVIPMRSNKLTTF